MRGAFRIWRSASWYRCVVFLFVSAIIGTNRAAAQENPRLVHVLVALADNEHQGIVPVPKALGNGDDPDRNLYWGAAFGVRTYLKKSSEWIEISAGRPSSKILARSVFRHQTSGTYLVADAYQGSAIKAAIEDFFRLAAGQQLETLQTELGHGKYWQLPAKTSLVVYVGHDGLMDFQLENTFPGPGSEQREAIVLACASKIYFSAGLRPTGARPLLWTTGLMAPEAYTLKAALDGWIAGESGELIRQRAADAYAKYQKISTAAAKRLFVSGW